VSPSPPRALLSIELRIVPEATALRVARGQVRSLLRDHGEEAARIEEALLGLDEVLTNSCFHGGAHRNGDPIELTVELFADRVTFDVRDRGAFVAADGDPPAGLPDEAAESGRGMFLIHSTMDEVCFEPREGGGTRVRLVKRR
jgi:anti-sigma regulatory factor (Ser/Thr protein kinase)